LSPAEIDEARKQIAKELGVKGVKEIPEGFFIALGMAIGLYCSIREMAEATRPAKVRQNLKDALEATRILNDKLNNLDGNSRQLLDEIEGGAQLQDVHLASIVRTLSEAVRLAKEYPTTRAGLHDHARLYLAKDVADAISEHLGRRATTTKEGVFESVLTIVLNLATTELASRRAKKAKKATKPKKQKEVSSVHALACRALKVQKKYQYDQFRRVALVEYSPEKDV
jgi:hypothetical protein